MKVSNLYIYGSKEYLRGLEEDYVFMGRQVRLEDGRLIVFASPKKRKKIKETRPRHR